HARLSGGASQHAQLARLVELGGLEPGIGDGLALAAHRVANLEAVLCLCGLADRDRDFARLVADGPADAQDVALIGVAPLVERSREPDARLHRGDDAAPCDLDGGCHAPPPDT